MWYPSGTNCDVLTSRSTWTETANVFNVYFTGIFFFSCLWLVELCPHCSRGLPVTNQAVHLSVSYIKSFHWSVIKALWPITKDINNPSNQSKLETTWTDAKCGSEQASHKQVMTGWKSGASFFYFDQPCSLKKKTPIKLRHSNKRRPISVHTLILTFSTCPLYFYCVEISQNCVICC